MPFSTRKFLTTKFFMVCSMQVVWGLALYWFLLFAIFLCLCIPLAYNFKFSSLTSYLVMQGPSNLVRDASCWQREHEWRQDIAVVTKWLSGVSPVCSYYVCVI